MKAYRESSRLPSSLLEQWSPDEAPFWTTTGSQLLVPSFLLVSIGADRNLWHKTEAEMVAGHAS